MRLCRMYIRISISQKESQVSKRHAAVAVAHADGGSLAKAMKPVSP